MHRHTGPFCWDIQLLHALWMSCTDILVLFVGTYNCYMHYECHAQTYWSFLLGHTTVTCIMNVMHRHTGPFCWDIQLLHALWMSCTDILVLFVGTYNCYMHYEWSQHHASQCALCFLVHHIMHKVPTLQSSPNLNPAVQHLGLLVSNPYLQVNWSKNVVLASNSQIMSCENITV